MNLPMAPTAAPQPAVFENIPALQAEVRALAREHDAVILAHNYQVPEVQDVADYVGDSLGLSQQAAKAAASVIAFCGVHFMAETASILCPDKTVLIPDLDAGCSLADSITADQLRHAVAHVGGRATLEASGGITLENLKQIADTGVDFISVGALTHSAPALDLSLLLEPLP